MENWLRNHWEAPSPSARQIDCIFAMDYEQKGLRALKICSDSGCRIWPYKNAGNLACGHRRGTLGPPSEDLDASKHFFKVVFKLITTFLELFCLHRRGHEPP